MTYPRLIGCLGLLWAVVLQRGALDWPSDTVWLVYTVSWIVACSLLIAGRATAPAALAVAGLSLALFIGPGREHDSPIVLLFWIGVSIGVTDRRPLERALLVRVTATAVYAFGTLAKLNPSFLSGEHLLGLARSRDQLESFIPMLETDLAIILSVGVITTEGFLAVGLWLRATRRVAVPIGIVLHVTLVAVASTGTHWDLVYLGVLNAGLVASYPAFFAPIRPGSSDQAGVLAAA